MNRSKLLPVLLFLLLLLILLCAWCHTETLVQNKLKSSNSTIASTLKSSDSKTIHFNLSKEKESFELTGSFSSQEEVEKILISLGLKHLKNSSTIDNNLSQNDAVITLTESLIPIFYDKYEKGSIEYTNGKLKVEGTVANNADKNAIDTLLANSTIPSVNNTLIVEPQPTAEELAAIEEAKAEALRLANEKEAQEEAKAKEEKLRLANEKAAAEAREKEEALRLANEKAAQEEAREKEEALRLENEKIAEAQEKALLEEQEAAEAREKAAEARATEEALRLANEKAAEESRQKELAKAQKEAQAVQEAEAQAQEKAKKIEAAIQKIIDFENINFELNQARLTPKSLNTLKQIATVLQENPNVRVKIAGHTDDLGDDTHNLNLSQQRVNRVKAKLIEMEIEQERIEAIGYGETQPLVANDSEENRQKNRRVEFKILGE